MKIRDITLKNVRRFQAASATITGLGDGITTICAPNESGKSTFFDALHAVFFYPHSGQPQEIRSLQPHSKGAVEISVDVEDDAGNPFRIEKKYLSSKSATITDLSTNRVIAQADEAEQWIKSLIGMDAQGPAGLLWVRQGISGFGPEGSGAKEKGEREKMREARQTLMSSVAGQIDNVTGGRRMDLIMKACDADFDALATKTGQPKAGGEWSKAVKRVEELEEEEGRLALQVSELGQALRDHAKIKSAHLANEDPVALAARNDAITAALKSLDDARGHERLILDRQRDLRLSELEAKSCSDIIEADDAAEALRKRLEVAETNASTEARETANETKKTAQHLKEEDERLTQARADLKGARDALSAARRTLDRRQKYRRKQDLTSLLDKIDKFEKDRNEHAATLRSIRITQEHLDRLNDLSQEMATVRSMREAGAAALQLSYSGSTFVEFEGNKLPEGKDIPILAAMKLDLPGIGSLKLQPPQRTGEGIKDLSEIASQIASLLAELEVETLDQARIEMRRRNDAERGELLARQSIETLAPEGTEQLRRDLADLGDEAETDDGAAIDIEDLHSKVTAAEDVERTILATQETARRDHEVANARATEARTRHSLASDALASPSDTKISPEKRKHVEGELHAALDVVHQIQSDIEKLQQEAPDTEAAEALVERLTSARDNAARERELRLERLNTLGGIIRARAEDGVETRLEEVRGQIEKASSRAARYKFEVDALSELRKHLEAARKEARDAYFEPVKKEIGPLLSMLHDDAGIEMDPDTMLPAKIVRDGVAEEIDNLSGGAAEQIAILTRLAFARLYAQSGKKVPVILDDALVYSDDDRIVKMFTALTRSAKDQQIIVLSCRTRAFEELGGTRAHIQINKAVI